MIKGLHATEPARGWRNNLALFGQFAGGWTIEARWFLPDGSTHKGSGEVHFGWILDGRALQDVWSSRQGRRLVPAGTTLRFYDAKLDAWQCAWVSPQQGALRLFIARKAGDEIVLGGATSDGRPERWVYSAITPVSFRWRAEEWDEGRKAWRLTEEMSGRRIETAGGSAAHRVRTRKRVS